MGNWFLYMIRTANGSLYTGISTEPERRLQQHISGRGNAARSLRGKGPLELVFQAGFDDRSSASKAEYRVKRLPKAIKEKLVQGVCSLDSIEC
ncbi:MAG: GIY-YIG nuclease family protein [Pseudohongiellaceae bacterium]